MGKRCDFLGDPEPSTPFLKSNVPEEKAQS